MIYLVLDLIKLKTLLLNTSFINPESLAGLKSGNEIQGKALRDILACIINLKSQQEFEGDNEYIVEILLKESYKIVLCNCIYYWQLHTLSIFMVGVGSISFMAC